MAAVYEKVESGFGSEIIAETRGFYESKANEAYYVMMDFLISLDTCKNTDQIGRLGQIFKTEKPKDWDYNIGFPKNDTRGKLTRDSPEEYNRTNTTGARNATKAPRGGPTSVFNQADEADYQGADEGNQDAEPEEYKLASPEAKPRRPEEALSTTRLMNSQVGKPPVERMTRGGQRQVMSQIDYGNQGESELNMLLRRKMSQLVVKFLDAVIDEDPKIENKTQSKSKLHAIINRKCQSLLTSVFCQEKNQFQKLLMMKVDSTKDAMAVDEIFDKYEILKAEGMENMADKRATDFLKGMLKMDRLASQISNLIMYSTTPLEDIVRYR